MNQNMEDNKTMEKENPSGAVEKNAKDTNTEKSEGSHRFMTLGMSIGMCFGMSIGLAMGQLLYENTATGMTTGMCLGMCIGMLLGAQKDKRINENALIVKEIIEDEFGCEGRPEGEKPQVTIIATDKEGKDQTYRMDDALVYERKINVGDRVFLEEDGTLELIEEKEEAPKEKRVKKKEKKK